MSHLTQQQTPIMNDADIDKKIKSYINRAKIIEDEINSSRQNTIEGYIQNVLTIAQMIQLEEMRS